VGVQFLDTDLEEQEVLEIPDVRPQTSDLLQRYSYEELCGQLAEHIALDSQPSLELIHLNEAVYKWESAHRVGQVKAFPVSASIAITDVCNVRCSFCNYTPERVSMQRIDPKQIATLNWLKFIRSLALTAGLGDTFAHPDIDQILELIAENYPYINMNFITNASLLKPRAISAIVGRANNMNISLNAARKDTYEATMSPLKWDTSIRNLKALRDAKESAGTEKPALIASYVLHAHNLDELPELPALLSETGINKARVNFMIPPVQNGSRSLMTDKDTIQNDTELVKRRIPEFERACLDHGIKLVTPLPNFIQLSGSRVEIRESTRNEKPVLEKASGVDATSGLNVPRSKLNNGKNQPSDGIAVEDVSTEFTHQVAKGQKPNCSQPWHTLTVDLMKRTHVCCSFFTHLPQFD
jgi:wyosine [tRNA(Phe)-imidazoG37] synthetase (radical SAM superfamily)